MDHAIGDHKVRRTRRWLRVSVVRNLSVSTSSPVPGRGLHVAVLPFDGGRVPVLIARLGQAREAVRVLVENVDGFYLPALAFPLSVLLFSLANWYWARALGQLVPRPRLFPTRSSAQQARTRYSSAERCALHWLPVFCLTFPIIMTSYVWMVEAKPDGAKTLDLVSFRADDAIPQQAISATQHQSTVKVYRQVFALITAFILGVVVGSCFDVTRQLPVASGGFRDRWRQLGAQTRVVLLATLLPGLFLFVLVGLLHETGCLRARELGSVAVLYLGAATLLPLASTLVIAGAWTRLPLTLGAVCLALLLSYFDLERQSSRPPCRALAQVRASNDTGAWFNSGLSTMASGPQGLLQIRPARRIRQIHRRISRGIRGNGRGGNP